MKPEERFELRRKIDDILTGKDRYSLIKDDRVDNDWEEDLKLLSELRNGVSERYTPKQEFDLKEVKKAIDKLFNIISKQCEIEILEMNKNMFTEMVATHNNGLFFSNPIEIKINDDMEDKAIKIKYRR